MIAECVSLQFFFFLGGGLNLSEMHSLLAKTHASDHHVAHFGFHPMRIMLFQVLLTNCSATVFSYCAIVYSKCLHGCCPMYGAHFTLYFYSYMFTFVLSTVRK